MGQAPPTGYGSLSHQRSTGARMGAIDEDGPYIYAHFLCIDFILA